MANTLKTMQGEILVSEIEAITIDNNLYSLVKNPMLPTKVIAVGKSGIKYDITTPIQGNLAVKVYNATLAFVAGTGHAVFDPATVK